MSRSMENKALSFQLRKRSNDNIARIAIDLIMNDVANMKSRVVVAGSSNNSDYKDFKLLISVRKPSTTAIVQKQKQALILVKCREQDGHGED